MSRSAAALALAMLLAASACAPLVQGVRTPPVGFAGPRLEADAVVEDDGTRLPATTWPATDAAGRPVEPWAVIVGLHGFADYARNFESAGPAWAKDGITTVAYDQRGHGRGPQRGVWGGEARMDQDLRTAVALARAAHPRAVIAVVGESMGAAVAITAFASPEPPAADRVVLVAPGVWGWRQQGPLNSAALWIAAHVEPGARLQPPRWLTRRILPSDNIEMLRALGADRNMIFRSRIDALYGIVGLMSDAQGQVGRVRAPTLFLYGARDQIIPKSAAFEAAAKLPAGARTAYYAQGFHMMLRDKQAPTVWRDIESFLRDPAAPLPSGAPPVPTAPGRGPPPVEALR